VKLLETDLILVIHEDQIQQYGGDPSHYIFSAEKVESRKYNISTISGFWIRQVPIDLFKSRYVNGVFYKGALFC
jgi:hypothetical protein